jgi:hypothetical protein
MFEGAAAAGDPGPQVVLRTCSTLALLAARVPEVEFLPDDADTSRVPWLAEVCAAAETVVSTLTDTRSGAIDPRSAPFPSDAGMAGAERLIAGMLAAQVRAAIDSWTSGDELPAEPPPPLEIPPAATMRLDFVMSLGFESIGGINGQADETSVALGPVLQLGALLARIGVIQLEIASLTFLGTDEIRTPVNALPLAVAGGCRFQTGPVFLAALLSVIAERWEPFGQGDRGGWRGGFGLTGGVVLPIVWLLELRLDLGLDFFPESYTVEDTPGETPGTPHSEKEIVADLANWRWRASLALQVRFPLL